jgi:hypothetical protein
MDAERRHWLEQLLEAARGAAEELEALDNPFHHRALLEDLEHLQNRLTSELQDSN